MQTWSISRSSIDKVKVKTMLGTKSSKTCTKAYSDKLLNLIMVQVANDIINKMLLTADCVSIS